MKQLSAILALIALATFSSAESAGQWNEYSLSYHLGFVAIPADLESKGPYLGTTLDGSLETSISFMAAVSPNWTLDTSLSMLKSTATLINSSPAHQLNYLDVDIQTTTLWLTLQSASKQYGAIRPWYGAGLHAGVVEEGYRERLYVPGSGYYKEDKIVKSTPLAGVHVCAGINIYPHRDSAICITAQGRLNFTATGSDFRGSLSSPALLIGLRWDFGLNPE